MKDFILKNKSLTISFLLILVLSLFNWGRTFDPDGSFGGNAWNTYILFGLIEFHLWIFVALFAFIFLIHIFQYYEDKLYEKVILAFYLISFCLFSISILVSISDHDFSLLGAFYAVFGIYVVQFFSTFKKLFIVEVE